jgi:cell division protein FtsL
MATVAVQKSQPTDWKNLYVAALLEGDVARIPSLIAEAERAIVIRARELFSTAGDHIQEEEALDDALYALHALKSCLAIHGRFAEAA